MKKNLRCKHQRHTSWQRLTQSGAVIKVAHTVGNDLSFFKDLLSFYLCVCACLNYVPKGKLGCLEDLPVSVSISPASKFILI